MVKISIHTNTFAATPIAVIIATLDRVLGVRPAARDGASSRTSRRRRPTARSARAGPGGRRGRPTGRRRPRYERVRSRRAATSTNSTHVRVCAEQRDDHVVELIGRPRGELAEARDGARGATTSRTTNMTVVVMRGGQPCAQRSCRGTCDRARPRAELERSCRREIEVVAPTDNSTRSLGATFTLWHDTDRG